jgi:hypothetical protein
MKKMNPRPQHLATLLGGLIVAGVAIVGGMMLADIDSDAKRGNVASSAGATATATPVSREQPGVTTTPVPTSVPVTPTPATAQTIPGLQGLPEALRDQIENSAAMTKQQIEELVRQRSNAVKVGIITRLRGNELTMKTMDGETYTTRITSKTAIRLGAKVLKRDDLDVGDTVFIVSMDGGDTAFSINSYGALANVR